MPQQRLSVAYSLRFTKLTPAHAIGTGGVGVSPAAVAVHCRASIPACRTTSSNLLGRWRVRPAANPIEQQKSANKERKHSIESIAH
jgi:hypothetical protein